MEVAPEVAAHMGPVVLAVEDVRIEPSGPAIDKAFAKLEARLQSQYGGKPASGIKRVREVREMFQALGIDPTRRRPSSEALLRRVLAGDGLYRISNAVDVANLASLQTLLPLGLYDFDRIEGNTLQLALGEQGAGYEGIRKGRVGIAGRPALRDQRGWFGAPTSDSARTAVTDATRRLLLVIFAPKGMSGSATIEATVTCAAQFQNLCGGLAYPLF